nr:hypothetical protein HK105_003973 [Polyrhizophydium stewartii]
MPHASGRRPLAPRRSARGAGRKQKQQPSAALAQQKQPGWAKAADSRSPKRLRVSADAEHRGHPADVEPAKESADSGPATEPADTERRAPGASGLLAKFLAGELLAAELRAVPEDQRERVWQDAIDADWQGNVRQLPDLDITSKTLRMRQVARVVIRNEWTGLLDVSDAGAAAEAAAMEDAVWLLVDLVEKRKLVKAGGDLVVEAATSGSLEVIKYLHAKQKCRRWDSFTGCLAASSGSLDLLAWLKKNRASCIDSFALQGAVDSNHMHLVRWLVENATVEVDSMALT